MISTFSTLVMPTVGAADFISSGSTGGIAIAMVIYFVAMILIGIYGYTRTQTMDDYMVGGRSLPPLVAALSAGAADMSGWLMMGLPGALYLSGLVESWIAIGLLIGSWCAWKWVAPRLRSYSQIAGDSITVPSFMSARLKDNRFVIQLVAGIIILFFFTIYVASGMVAGGVFFESIFGVHYHVGMVIVAGVVILYTLVGGFLAVSWTDMVQGIMMLIALLLVPVFGIVALGGLGVMGSTLSGLEGQVMGDATFSFSMLGSGAAAKVSILNGLAWGLGYVGMPHVIVRYMALRSPKEAVAARRLGIGWMFLCVLGATLTALIGRALVENGLGGIKEALARVKVNPQESIYLVMGEKLFPAVLAGFMLAAILAAIMSTVSSQLLVTSSAVVEDIYRGIKKKRLLGAKGINTGRMVVLAISVIAAFFAWFRTDSILGLVAFAWAGFGAAFGPVILLCLYWRKYTWQGAAAGMAVGAITVGIWGNIPDEVFGLFQVYEILPGFLLNLLVSWLVSRATYKPNKEIDEEFDLAIKLASATQEEINSALEGRQVTPVTVTPFAEVESSDQASS
ncbi:sodium/proline symporter PutP [Varibaculum massiliense]|uniref:sodium/proline symporter PutP n=1 Tax=Varibaculum massiliense TaxID=1852372 RepID=UPI0035D113F2